MDDGEWWELVEAIDKALTAWEEVTLPEMDGDADQLAAAMDDLAELYAKAMMPPSWGPKS